MMQVATMSHIPSRDESLEAQFRQHQQQMYAQARSQPPNPPMLQTQYITPSSQAYSYAYQQRVTAPPSPTSPAGDELNKPSLPSISSLLETTGQNQAQAQQMSEETQQQVLMTPTQQYHQDVMPQSAASVVSNHIKMTLPPTPPLGPESIIDGTQSPTAMSVHSTVSAPAFFMQPAVPHLESQHRHYNSITRPTIMTQHPLVTSYPSSPYPVSPYHASPTHTLPSSTSYYPTETPILPSSGMYAQRPLPSNFPPPLHIPMTPGPSLNTPSPWQHHHYINSSSQATFPPTQDRYICPTCKKAFSRPSSLRIHSHSHTGEKPFKCSHPGCGKAFSVRSNMKRHERGCHAGNGMLHI